MSTWAKCKIPCVTAAAGVMMFQALGGMVGCASDPRSGYSTSTTFPEDVSTISVPIFKNTSTTVGIEAGVTEAIIKELQRQSGMRVVSGDGGGGADSRLRGVITQVQLRKMSVRSGTGLVQELAYQITVDFDWKDERNGKVLVSRREFTATDTFVPATGVGERIEVGLNATTQRLAKDIVNEMRSAW